MIFPSAVELEGADTTPYADVQYQVLANIVAALCRAYPRLSPARTVGHSDIAPGRKTDPGPAFDWPLTRRLIAAGLPARCRECSRRGQDLGKLCKVSLGSAARTSLPLSWRASTRASTNSRSDRRFK